MIAIFVINVNILVMKWIYSLYPYADRMGRADTHTHTLYSGVGGYGALKFPESVTRPETMVDHARSKGLDVLCITDHDAVGGAFVGHEYAKRYDDIEVVIGEEVSTADGEVIGLWLNEEIPAGLTVEETIDIIRSQGGVTIAPHPFSFHVPALGDRIFNLDLDGIETLNGGHIDKYSNKMAKEVRNKYPNRWAELGSSDGHSTATVGYSWTEFEGNTADDLRKAILSKTTVPAGRPIPIDKGTLWSMEVVLSAGWMILKSLFKRLKPDPTNPLVERIEKISTPKKVAAILGASVYIFPPIPFIASIASNQWLNKRASALLEDIVEKLDSV